MTKRRFYLLVTFISFTAALFGQNNSIEKYPVFPNCSSEAMEALPSCFDETVKDLLFSNLELPSKVSEENYKGEVNVLFEVDEEGAFKVLYVDAVYKELKEAVDSAFLKFPKPSYLDRSLQYELYNFWNIL